MKNTDSIASKIVSLPKLVALVKGWRVKGETVSFTNGCFDILHIGHISSLNEAATHSNRLVVAINSDNSVKGLKGEERPINQENDRALMLANMIMVDAVVIFDEPTPLEVIKAILPDVLVKGGDYTVNQISGAKEVISNGGKVVINALVEGFSTTGILQKLAAL